MLRCVASDDPWFSRVFTEARLLDAT
jgi:hypothetical protein